MPNSRRFTLKSVVAVSAATVLLGAGAVPAAHSAPKSKLETTTETTTETIGETTETIGETTETTVLGGPKDTKTSGGGRKIG